MQIREHVPLAIITIALVAAMIMLYREVTFVKNSLKKYQTKLQNQSLFLADTDPMQASGLPTSMPTEFPDTTQSPDDDNAEGEITGADDE
jgi:hypothetical protein